MADPKELHEDVAHQQAILDDFSRVLKRKQADLVLLQTELQPLLHAENESGEKPKEPAVVGFAVADDAPAKVAGKAVGGRESTRQAKGKAGPGKKPTPTPQGTKRAAKA